MIIQDHDCQSSSRQLDSGRQPSPQRRRPSLALGDTRVRSIVSHVPPAGAHAAKPAASDWQKGLPILRGPGVTLRQIEPQDATALFDALAPQDVEAAFEPAPTSAEMFGQYISWARKQITTGRAACFAIVPDGSLHAVGVVQLRRLDSQFKTADWGIVLAPAWRGTGLFVDVAQTLLRFAFETVGVHRLEARTGGTNLPACAAMRKIGAKLEACLPKSFLCGGRYLDDELWVIADRDWQEIRAALALAKTT